MKAATTTDEYTFPITEIRNHTRSMIKAPQPRLIEIARTLNEIDQRQLTEDKRILLLALEIHCNEQLIIAPHFRTWRSPVPRKPIDPAVIRYARDRQVIDLHWFAKRYPLLYPGRAIKSHDSHRLLVHDGNFNFEVAQEMATLSWTSKHKVDEVLQVPENIQVECAALHSEKVRGLKNKISKLLPKARKRLEERMYSSKSKLTPQKIEALLGDLELLELTGGSPKRATELEQLKLGHTINDKAKRERQLSDTREASAPFTRRHSRSIRSEQEGIPEIIRRNNRTKPLFVKT